MTVFTGDHGGDEASEYGVRRAAPRPKCEQCGIYHYEHEEHGRVPGRQQKSKPVVRAEHMKIIRAKKAQLDRALDQLVVVRKEYNQAILDAYDAGLHRDSISEAAGISKDRAKQIKQHGR